MLYIGTDLSLAELVSHPLLEGVHLRTLERWCADGAWVVKRREANQKWEGAFEKRVFDAVAEVRLTLLRNVTALHDQAVELLKIGVLQPKSWEGLAMTAVRTAHFANELAERMLAAAPAPATERPACSIPDEALPNLSHKDAFFLAHQLMKLRRGNPEVVAEYERAESEHGPPPDDTKKSD